MGGRPEIHITYPRNTRLEETSRIRRRMEGGLSPEGAVTPWMDRKENTQVVCTYRHVHACDFASGIHMLCRIFYIQQII
jgi:hypothetical protein